MAIVSTTGLGGGGAMYTPAVSPHDPSLRFLACDMGGLYRTSDAGANWELLDWHAMGGDIRCRVVFDPADPQVIYAYAQDRGLKRSPDRGSSWGPNLLPMNWVSQTVTALGVDPAGRIFVGTTKGAHYLDGTAWTDFLTPNDDVVAFVLTASNHFAATTGSIFKADPSLGTWTPSVTGLPVPSTIRDLVGGDDPMGGQTTLYVCMPSTAAGATVTDGAVYVSTNAGANWTKAYGGLDLDRGTAGAECELPQYEHLAIHPSNPRVCYVSICAAREHVPPDPLAPRPYEYRLYRTQDAGGTWVHVLNVDGSVPSTPVAPNVTGGWQDFAPFGWGNTGRARGLGVGRSARGGDHSVMFTNNGVLYQSEDSALSWQQAYTELYPLGQGPPGSQPQSWRSIGLEVTTAWRYVISPDDPNLRFICYTDIAFARSTDGGRTWFPIRKDTAGNLYNTFYEIAFDLGAPAPGPGQFRTMWAAASNHHDLPYWDHLLDGPYIGDPSVWSGAVLRSTDGGATWSVFGTGLPAGGAVSIVSDGGAPARLWAAVWGSGVYEYNQATGAWDARNTGLGNGANKHVYRLLWLPGGPNGRLYCLIVGRRNVRGASDAFLDDPGGLWLSTDGGTTWTRLTDTGANAGLREAMRQARDFTVDGANTQRIYICVGDVPQANGNPPAQLPHDGSLWTTGDGGLTWGEIPTLQAQASATGYYYAFRPFAPFIDPHKPTRLWVTSERHGLWMTEDATVAAPTWAEYRDVPFLALQRLLFAPGSSPQIMVSTFGYSVAELDRQCFFIMNRSAFSEYEVGTALPRVFPESVFLIFDGFMPSELGITPTNEAWPQLTLTLRSTGLAPAVTLVPNRLDKTDPTLTYAGRFTYVYDIQFTGTTDFPATGEDNVDVVATKDWLGATGSVKLFRQPNPYMLDGQTPYLSDDLRVLQIRQGSEPVPGFGVFTGTAVSDALAYLQGLVSTFNAAPVSGTHPFDSIPVGYDESVLTLQPQDSAGRALFNLTVARVRFHRPPAAVPAALRVFFRTFKTQSASLDYQPTTTYRSENNTAAPSDLIPVLGHGGGPSFEVVSIPCFDQPRVDTVNFAITTQPEPTKVQLQSGPTPDETWQFFGGLLDFNQTDPRFPVQLQGATDDGPWTAGTGATQAQSVQDLVRGHHQCLVAEINYPPDPIGVGETPSSSENLAQRNLAIEESANPGHPDSRTVHHTFQIAPSGPPAGAARRERGEEVGPGLDFERPDELMFEWSVPPGTEATLSSRVEAMDAIMGLAIERRGPGRLRRLDASSADLLADGVSYVPVPFGDRWIPALLSVRLPEGVHTGERYKVVVRQIAGGTHAVRGTFEIGIPVRHARHIRGRAEDTLAVFRHITGRVDHDDPWAPVMTRYTDRMADRVRALGGHPERIPASPYGAPHRRRAGCLGLAAGIAVLGAALWRRFVRRR
jgi:hypothetical protein